MCPFHSGAVRIMREFDDVKVSYMPRECNHRANHIAKVGSWSRSPIDLKGSLITIKERLLPLIQMKGLFTEVCTILIEDDDWRVPIIGFLSSPSR